MVINPIVGVYIPIIRIPIKGGMTIPNISLFHIPSNVSIQEAWNKERQALAEDSGSVPFKSASKYNK